MNLAIIPARSGSTRLKNKNILSFNGKPMIAWTIEAAKKSKIFDYIYVSTDSKKIASIAIKYGAKVPFLRDKKLSDNFTSVHEVTYDAVIKLEKKINKSFKNVFQLMPNCPLRNDVDIKNFYKYFKNNKIKSLVSCTKFHFGNPWWAFYQNKKNVKRLFPKLYKKRSQDLPEAFTPTGAIWITNKKNFLKTKSFYSTDFKFKELSWKSAIDIDTKEDFMIAKSVKI